MCHVLSWIYINNCNGESKICYITRGNKPIDDWLTFCKASFPKGFMLVAGLSGKRPLPLIKVPVNVKINSEYYIKHVLEYYLEQIIPSLYGKDVNKVYFHHDAASSHTSKKTLDYLESIKIKYGINYIKNSEIPIKSPDASPLDFFGFGYLKQKLCLHYQLCAANFPGSTMKSSNFKIDAV